MNASTRAQSRVAIVTGGARGIGRAVATRLVAEGLSVAILDLDGAASADTAAQIAQQSGGRVIGAAVDVSSEPSVRSAVAQVAAALGPPTVLVNNAGLLREHTLGKTSLEDWTLVLNVNLVGAFLMSRELVPFLRGGGQGRIVNLSSTGALGAVGLAAYSAAKAGLQGLTKTLSIELARYQVTVNAVAPGFVASAMTAGVAQRVGVSFDEMQERVQREVPLGRVGTPEDIAHAVAFFVDERSSYVTGQVLYVAGGPKV
jgi:3-oxoacyl-[acyl-carrier protein] reductase